MNSLNKANNKNYFINNYPKLDIPEKAILNKSKINEYIEFYPFTNNLKLYLGVKGLWDKQSVEYLITNHLNNTLASSDPSRYFEPYGIRFSINYIEFLKFLKKTNITLKTNFIYCNGILQFYFLSYPDAIVSPKEEQILNNLFSASEEAKSINKLIENHNEYHIGNDIFQEYSRFLHSNKNYVRMLSKDGKYHWIEVKPIIWNVDEDNNQLITDKIIVPFDEPFVNNAYECIRYINQVLYPEMNYHPEQYISNNIIDKIRISHQLIKNRKYLLDNQCQNLNAKSKVLKR